MNAFLLPTLIVLGATYVSQGGIRGFTLAGFFVIYYFFISRLANQFGNAVSEALSTSHALKAARTRVESQARALKELARRHELAARKAEEAVRGGCEALILSDEAVGPGRAPIPMILATMTGTAGPRP